MMKMYIVVALVLLVGAATIEADDTAINYLGQNVTTCSRLSRCKDPNQWCAFDQGVCKDKKYGGSCVCDVPVPIACHSRMCHADGLNCVLSADTMTKKCSVSATESIEEEKTASDDDVTCSQCQHIVDVVRKAVQDDKKDYLEIELLLKLLCKFDTDNQETCNALAGAVDTVIGWVNKNVTSLAACQDLDFCPKSAAPVETAEPKATAALQDDPLPKCCVTCEAPAQKYWSYDGRKDLCGISCIKPLEYPIFHIFEKNLTLATSDTPCRDRHFTKYFETQQHGFGPLTTTVDLYDH